MVPSLAVRVRPLSGQNHHRHEFKLLYRFRIKEATAQNERWPYHHPTSRCESFKEKLRPSLVNHRDGILGASVHASLTVSAVIGIDLGLAVSQSDTLGGADVDAVLAAGALGGIDESGHDIPPGKNW